MSNVIKAPIKFRDRTTSVRKKISDMLEAPDRMVWDMCVYTNPIEGQRFCKQCPAWEDTDFGKEQRMCYRLAKEACQLAMAWQMEPESKTR